MKKWTIARRSTEGRQRAKFRGHKGRADRHGIAFHFTFEEWQRWWFEHLGPSWEKLRGHCAGQYVMGRKGDVGPYHPDNVMCITTNVNAKMARFGEIQTVEHKLKNSMAHRGVGNPRAKLNEKQVLEIFKAAGTVSGLARQYEVSRPIISGIKDKKLWKHLTEGL